MLLVGLPVWKFLSGILILFTMIVSALYNGVLAPFFMCLFILLIQTAFLKKRILLFRL